MNQYASLVEKEAGKSGDDNAKYKCACWDKTFSMRFVYSVMYTTYILRIFKFKWISYLAKLRAIGFFMKKQFNMSMVFFLIPCQSKTLNIEVLSERKIFLL